MKIHKSGLGGNSGPTPGSPVVFKTAAKKRRASETGRVKDLVQWGKTGNPAKKEKSKLAARAKAAPPEASSSSRSSNLNRKGEPRRWTLLCYFAGDNNFEEQMAADIVAMERRLRDNDLNIVLQFDRGEHPNLKIGGKPGTVRYHLQPFKVKPEEIKAYSRYNPPDLEKLRSKHRKISSPVIKELGALDSSHPQPLQDFLTQGMKEFPAENYLIYIYGHGAGLNGFITDEGPECKRFLMPAREFKAAVANAEKQAGITKDRVILAVDSCQMAQTEIAYEFKDIARFMLASQSLMKPGGLMPRILGEEKIAGLDARGMGEELFRQGIKPQELETSLLFDGPTPQPRPQTTRSLIDLKQMPALKTQMAAFIKALRNTGDPREKILKHLEVSSRTLYYTSTALGHCSSDLPALTRQILKDPELGDKNLKKAALGLKKVLDKAIIRSYRKNDLGHNKNSSGLGILVSCDRSVYRESGRQDFAHVDYQNFDFERDTGWGKFIADYTRKADPEKIDRELADPAVNSPRLKQLGRLAQAELKHFASLAKELDAAKAEIRDLKDDSRLSRLEKSVRIFDLKNRLSLSREMDEMINGSQAPEKDYLEAVKEKLFPELPDSGKVRITLYALAQLGGEISTRSLAQTAGKLLEASGEKGFTSRQLAFAKKILTALGFGARNERVINLDNFYGSDGKKMLEQLSLLA